MQTSQDDERKDLRIKIVDNTAGAIHHEDPKREEQGDIGAAAKRTEGSHLRLTKAAEAKRQ